MKACWSGRGQPVPEVAPDRVCRVCGCSEHDPCETAGGPCGWAGAELCTACDGRPYELWLQLGALVERHFDIQERLSKGITPAQLERLEGSLRAEFRRARKALQPPDRSMG